MQYNVIELFKNYLGGYENTVISLLFVVVFIEIYYHFIKGGRK